MTKTAPMTPLSRVVGPGMTLVEELVEAALDADYGALQAAHHELPTLEGVYRQRAARLRARAAHVRRMLDKLDDVRFTGKGDSRMASVWGTVAAQLRLLTGPDIGQPQEGGET